MLSLNNIYNISIAELQCQQFDLGIFCSGYESRASYLAKQLQYSQFRDILVLGFEEHSSDDIRLMNDEFYLENYRAPLIVSSQDQEKIYLVLREVFKKFSEKTINVLVDYTSMARLWYSGIFNFFRVHDDLQINVFINYSIGSYKQELLDYPYSSINSLPQLEGSLSSNNKTLLVLAVGFSPYLIKSVIEEIEPNNVIGILPTSSNSVTYEEHSYDIKAQILSHDIDTWIHCPINDLESIFRNYAEITSFNISEKDIIFLSLGPKIFTVASILVSQRFDQITCLYLKSKRHNIDVSPIGEVICNKIIYRPEL